MQGLGPEKCILAIDVRARSFGFVAFEGTRPLLDYGVRSFRQGVNRVKISASKKIAGLMDLWSPSTVVLKKWTADKSRKRARMRDAVMRQARLRQIPVRLLPHDVIRNAFAGDDRNKFTIASTLAQRYPELAPKLPPKRKIWQSEDYHMSIFDAAALGVAYFHRKKTNQSARNELTNPSEVMHNISHSSPATMV
jgi:hypothetical protein